METFHFQFNLNYNYKFHYYKVICNWLAWFYKKKNYNNRKVKGKTEKNKATKIKTDVTPDLSMVYFCNKIITMETFHFEFELKIQLQISLLQGNL